MAPSNVVKVLFGVSQIQARVRELGREIRQHYAHRRIGVQGDDLIMVPVLTGGMIFAADLMREMALHFHVKPVMVESYQGEESTGRVCYKSPRPRVGGAHVLLVEDILDSGLTLRTLKRDMAEAGAVSVATVVLLDKGKAGFAADWTGFQCPDKFVIGYGLDAEGLHRNSPDVVYRVDETDPVG